MKGSFGDADSAMVLRISVLCSTVHLRFAESPRYLNVLLPPQHCSHRQRKPRKEREEREKVQKENKSEHQLLAPHILYDLLLTVKFLKQKPLSIITEMGEENKEEGKKDETTEEKKEEEKKDAKKEEEPPEIVLKVDMHCEACARKVAKALKGFEGVEEVTAYSKESKVVVKGKAADPIKVCERLRKKSGKKVELISPLPKPPEEKKKEEIKEPQPEEKKEEPPPVVTVVLKVRMHCEACAQVIQKQIRKIQGVESVETNLGNDQVIVKGVIDPAKLVDYVYKRTKKQASIVKDQEKKEEEKKEEEKKEEKEEENKEGEEENKGEDGSKTDIKRSEYLPSTYYVDYAYAPQIFSDDNPNACSVM